MRKHERQRSSNFDLAKSALREKKKNSEPNEDCGKIFVIYTKS